jgi:hypothetical protein
MSYMYIVQILVIIGVSILALIYSVWSEKKKREYKG